MSNALAIAAVSASLKDLLSNGLIDHDLSSIGSISVTAQPPDRVSTGQTESNLLNLFLYQVTPNAGWRNAGLPSRDAQGRRVANPPLALDLHYLLTAYGAADLNAEVLLGYGMQLLHENPILTREQLRTVLAPPAPVDGSILPGPFGSLSAATLADQVELIKISPVYLSAEDLSKLWAAMQARYRPSMAYVVSVVLIQAEFPLKASLPVLKRGPDDRGPEARAGGFPVLTAARSAVTELVPAVRLGEDVVLSGTNLASEERLAVVEATALGIERTFTPRGQATSRDLLVHLPSTGEEAAAMSSFAAGLYTVHLRIGKGNGAMWRTNRVPFVLAPSITVEPRNAVAGSTIDLELTCTPRLRAAQKSTARLLFGDQEIKPTFVETPLETNLPSKLRFTVPPAAAGVYPVRLRVDGVDSLPVTTTGSPPKLGFDPIQTVTVQ